MKQCHPYAGLAPLYDRVMQHVQYEVWASYIASLFRRHRTPTRSVLEIACGTGSLARIMARRGYRMTGIDRSPAMLRVAREKLGTEELSAHFIAADMTRLPLDGAHPYDAAICLYDSVNYLLDPGSFARALAEAARVIRPGGLHIFDICTIRNSELYFARTDTAETIDGVLTRRRSTYDPDTHLQENTFIFECDGERSTETHRQRIYRISEIERLVAASPLELVDIYDDMSFEPGSEESERVHFVLRRPLGTGEAR